VKTEDNNTTHWGICPECEGRGKKSRKFKKKARQHLKEALEQYEKLKAEGKDVLRPNKHLYTCEQCNGSGLVVAEKLSVEDNTHYPHVAIVGGGIGGVALAVACLHRGIPFTLYERDNSFDARSQGYGLTLQQASKAMPGLGITALKEGVYSTRHVVHSEDGKVIGEWGLRKRLLEEPKRPPKRTNVHITRQALRMALLDQLGGVSMVQWGHQLTDVEPCADGTVALRFQVDGQTKSVTADLVVGADGVRSAVRRLVLGEESNPLRYLGCIVILGICPLAAIDVVDRTLLDSATVFQTANGVERIYVMPFTNDLVMWQLSFPMAEEEAKVLSGKGSGALKVEACKRTQWHAPIPQIVGATDEVLISGYPVYDRALFEPSMLAQCGAVTLIGDAAHPMSPFKGQGANQALLDALSLARGIAKGCNPASQWRTAGIRERVLTEFETEMAERSATKVKDSQIAAEFLHSDIVLQEGDRPRGGSIRDARLNTP
jgi:2-polyprenyl-6-methoxyphenol hydroxylase-like FAD-dependent oxidoreductase